MISTKDLSGLPNAERLKNFCKGLAALDIIMVEEEWSFIRHYTYNLSLIHISGYCNPMDGEDASKDLLPLIDGDPQTYVEYGKWFYPADLPLETVRQLADGVPVTKELVIALNPKRNEWEEIKAGLDKIGYPNEL